MLSYFTDKYIDPDWGAILTAILSALGMYFLCFKRVGRRDVPKEVLRFICYWAAWVLLSALFYWAFPHSNMGFALVPLVFSVPYIIFDRRLILWERVVRTSVFVTICVYSSAIFLPLAMLDGNTFPMSVPVFSLVAKALLFAGAICILQRFALGRFRFSVYFFMLIEAVCVIGYALNLVSIAMGIDAEFRSAFSANFFNSISLTVIELLVYLMFYKLSDESDKKDKLMLEEMRIKNELKMMSMYEIGYNQVRSVRHEIYDQYSYVNIMLKNGQYKEAERYFDQLRVFVGSMGKAVYTENRIANIALNLTVEQAERAGIKTDVKAALPRRLGIPDAEFASLLNNLASNGIEACGRLKDGSEKFLDVTLSYENGYLLVKMVNSADTERLRSERGLPVTSKSDKSAHGIGLSVVRRIAERHGGCFDWKAENGIFTARVLVRCDIEGEGNDDEEV